VLNFDTENEGFQVSMKKIIFCFNFRSTSICRHLVNKNLFKKNFFKALKMILCLAKLKLSESKSSGTSLASLGSLTTDRNSHINFSHRVMESVRSGIGSGLL
jgi:hypothetical protein